MKRGMESFRWKTVAETPKDTGNLAPCSFSPVWRLFPHWKDRNGVVDMELKHMTGESVITRQLAPSVKPSF